MVNQLDLFNRSAANTAASAPRATFRREHERHAANWPARCYHDQGAWKATVIDVSEGGVGLDRDLPVAKDEIITLELPDVGSYTCRVAWKRDGRCGLQFLRRPDELSADAIDSLADTLTGM